MANMLKTGMEFLFAKKKEHAAETVTIRRGAYDTTGVKAEVGRAELVAEDVDGSGQLRVSDRDFMILAADYQINGSVVEPADGDQILQTVGAEILLFEVRPMAGFQAWTWSDPYQTRLRIHGKLVGSE